jgi:hypothetical protein
MGKKPLISGTSQITRLLLQLFAIPGMILQVVRSTRMKCSTERRKQNLGIKGLGPMVIYGYLIYG